MKKNREKPAKVIKKVDNITYLEPSPDPSEKKYKRSLETRKKMSEKRRALTKQPRSGQSKKAQTFFDQLLKDYINKTSPLAKFSKRKLKKLTSEQIHAIISTWMIKNKAKLQAITSADGVAVEYDIQKINFTEIKLGDMLFNDGSSVEEEYTELNTDFDLDLEIHNNYIAEMTNYLTLSGANDSEIFTFVQKENFVRFLELNLMPEKEIEKILPGYEKKLPKLFSFFCSHEKFNKPQIIELFNFAFLLTYKKIKDKTLLKEFAKERNIEIEALKGIL